MRLPTLDSGNALAPAMERLLDEASSREAEPAAPRERRAEAGAAAALIAASVAVQLIWPGRSIEVGPAIALTVAYALATRVRFYVGAGFTAPTQLVLVPMLFVLPAGLVPLFVAAGCLLALLPDVLTRRVPADRLLLRVPDAWHAFGPALVFAAAGVDHFAWHDTWIYVGAFAAQLGSDALGALAREWLILGVPPRVQMAVVSRVYAIDLLLTPIGLLVAYAAAAAPYRALLVLPLVLLFGIFA